MAGTELLRRCLLREETPPDHLNQVQETPDLKYHTEDTTINTPVQHPRLVIVDNDLLPVFVNRAGL